MILPLDTNTYRQYNECMRRFQIYIPEPMMERLKKISAEKDLPVADLIRRACEKYLEGLEKHENSS